MQETVVTRATQPAAIKATFLGTSTLLFDDGETQILIDAFVTRPPFKTVAFDRIVSTPVQVNAALQPISVERVKAIFVSHSHYDHALDVPALLELTKATLYGSESTLNIARGARLNAEPSLMLITAKGEYRVDNFHVTAIPSRHSPPLPGVNNDLGMMIDHALEQPARFHEYHEGGSFDFLIEHRGRRILVKPSAGYVEGALNGERADVIFLATGSLGHQCESYRAAYYVNTVGATSPRLVIPTHWDDFFTPLSGNMKPSADTVIAWFDLTTRLHADGIKFAVLQGRQSIELFSPRMDSIAPAKQPSGRYLPPSVAVENPCRA